MTKEYRSKSHIRRDEFYTYVSWQCMKTRCLNPNTNRAKYYKDKGITVCDKWMTIDGFVEDMGIRPLGRSLDRIDLSKGYYKENCRWATPEEQANNQTRSRRIEYKGQVKTLTEWARLFGANIERVRTRYYIYHWDMDKCLSCKDFRL